MLATAIIVFREVLEAALVVSIVLAATRGVVRGGLWVSGGVLVGVGAGAAIGTALYLGLLRIPSSRLFAVTGWMILLLAAGMAAQGAAFLVQADILPALGQSVWDTTWLVADESILGRVLHTLIGYTARPYGIQLLFYFATLGAIIALMKLVNASERAHASTATAVSASPSR